MLVNCSPRMSALTTFVKNFIARLGRCTATLFGVPFGPRALPKLTTLITRKTSEALVNVGPLVGA